MHLKGLYDNIGVLISDNSLSSEIVIDISNFGSVSGIPKMLKILTKLLLIQD